uniref:Uncharacterized protein n=1 Tax=viral metagenome TaxID=1070528 RepID=A0A6C0D2W0_9ZZZZ
MPLYTCTCCNFNTMLKSNYSDHLNTRKHIAKQSRPVKENKTETCVKEDEKQNTPEKKGNELNELIELLKNQLENKDKQLESQSKQIDKLLETIRNKN